MSKDRFLAIPPNVVGNPKAKEIVSVWAVADGDTGEKGHVEIAVATNALDGVEVWGVLLVDILMSFTQLVAKAGGHDPVEVLRAISKAFIEELDIRRATEGALN